MTPNRWGLLTNHALVLIHVIENPRSTLRDIADGVGITERAALSLLRALEADAIITRRKEGRRNVYTVDVDALMEHRSAGKYSIGQIANALFAISGRIPGMNLPPGMQITFGADGHGPGQHAVVEQQAQEQRGGRRPRGS